MKTYPRPQKNKSSADLTDEDLLEYEEHIEYEVNMLKFTAEFFPRLPESQGVIRNVVLEAFCIHARNLIDFLFSYNPRPTDVTIRNFLSQEKLAEVMPQQSEVLKHAHWQAGKQIAHLTTDRAKEPEAKSWNIFQIAEEIFSILRSIAPHLPSSKISDHFRNKLLKITLGK